MWAKSGRLMEQEELSEKIIGAAIRVHRSLGPGFLEAIYEEALCVELAALELHFERQHRVEVLYRGQPVGEHRLDLLVEDVVVVELKAVLDLQDIFYATLRSYLKATGKPFGLILNFACSTLQVKRVGPEQRPGN